MAANALEIARGGVPRKPSTWRAAWATSRSRCTPRARRWCWFARRPARGGGPGGERVGGRVRWPAPEAAPAARRVSRRRPRRGRSRRTRPEGGSDDERSEDDGGEEEGESAAPDAGEHEGGDGEREAMKLAVAILETLSGLSSPAATSEALGVSREPLLPAGGAGAAGAGVGDGAASRGRTLTPERERDRLKAENDRLQRELLRYQALVRTAQRTIGLAKPSVRGQDRRCGAGRGRGRRRC